MQEELKSSKNKEPRYVISVASRILGIETHTLRYYERIGLVKPYRSEGRIRYYSESDIEQLKYINKLMNELGVNPAGVEVVIKMARMMSQMQERIEQLTQALEEARKGNAEAKKKKGKKS